MRTSQLEAMHSALSHGSARGTAREVTEQGSKAARQMPFAPADRIGLQTHHISNEDDIKGWAEVTDIVSPVQLMDQN